MSNHTNDFTIYCCKKNRLALNGVLICPHCDGTAIPNARKATYVDPNLKRWSVK